MSVAAKKGTKMAAKWSPARGAVRSEPFPLLRSVVRNGPERSRARRCWARRSEPLTARTVLRGSLKRERRGERLAKSGPPFWYPGPPPLTIALRTQDAETTRNPRRPINRVRLVKREAPLFEVPEHVVCGPVENGVPVQPLGAPRNAGEFRLWFRYGRFGTIRAFLPADAASRQDGLTRKPLNQCPAYDRGLQFRSAESHRGRRPRQDEFNATQFRVPPYVVLPARAPTIQEIPGLSPHYDQLQPEPVGESVACRQ